MLMSLALLAGLVIVAHSSSTGGGRSHSYDISDKSDLTRLYNSKVYEAERMKRPLDNFPFMGGPLSHSGVRVTLEDGSQWLIHKGDRFGHSSQTVVVDADHMSSRWKTVETKNFEGSKTVSDLVEAGGADYSLRNNNCHDGADRMMGQ